MSDKVGSIGVGAPWRRRLALLTAANVGLILGVVSASESGRWGPDSADRPSMIVILADDLGWGELGSYGQRVIRTPHLDAMAREGLRFQQFYAGATVCAPSRSVFLTGKHQGRTRVRGNSTDFARGALRRDDVTVAVPLRDAGYRTAIFGKWGLGELGAASGGLPHHHGFERFVGFLNHWHAHNHFPDFLWRDRDRISLPNRARSVGELGGSITDDPILFADDLITDQVLQFVTKHQGQRFFIYWCPLLPHANNERYHSMGDGAQVPDFGPYTLEDWPEPDKGHAAMITRLDSYVGRLLHHLRSLHLAESTLVFFTSDNGPHRESGHDISRFQPTGPWRGMKRDLWEGGIRVPAIAWWPGTIEPGRLTKRVAYLGDWFATAMEMAGLPVPDGLDSLSLVATFMGKEEESPQHEFLYWEFTERVPQQAGLIDGRWKIHRRGAADQPLEIFDLAVDPREENNVAPNYPELVRRGLELLENARTPSTDWPLFESR
jgi:arylsulfatase A-like enzyme